MFKDDVKNKFSSAELPNAFDSISTISKLVQSFRHGKQGRLQRLLNLGMDLDVLLRSLPRMTIKSIPELLLSCDLLSREEKLSASGYNTLEQLMELKGSKLDGVVVACGMTPAEASRFKRALTRPRSYNIPSFKELYLMFPFNQLNLSVKPHDSKLHLVPTT